MTFHLMAENEDRDGDGDDLRCSRGQTGRVAQVAKANGSSSPKVPGNGETLQ